MKMKKLIMMVLVALIVSARGATLSVGVTFDNTLHDLDIYDPLGQWYMILGGYTVQPNAILNQQLADGVFDFSSPDVYANMDLTGEGLEFEFDIEAIWDIWVDFAGVDSYIKISFIYI
jgi:hypothetical protein